MANAKNTTNDSALPISTLPTEASTQNLEASTVQNENEPSYYVAIGASAGGLEALQELFEAMPADTGASFIVIQHLSPDFKSVMAELLSRNTSMPVLNVTDNLLVEKNRVYLIPPRKNMMIAEGKLILVDQMPDRGINFPIDIFFRSVAEDQHHRSIGMIVSGTGSDGSRGIQAIKEVGGLVMVQDPATAKFDGMPYSAVKTGFADVVLSPTEIPNKLVHYMTHPMNRSESSILDETGAGQATINEIFKLLKKRSDIDFTQYKTSTIARRIERRLGLSQLTNIQDYHTLLLTNPHELQTLAKDMLIGVTRFFRDTEVFEKLEESAIPVIIDQVPSSEPIRVWVAGCSTGEEAYSIAILFAEAMAKKGVRRNVKIFATDVDPDAIVEASSGQFNLNIRTDVSEVRLSQFFNAYEDHYKITAEIRSMVIFANHNLMKDPPFSNTNLAICRNVLIYFQHEAQRRVLSMLHFSLQKDGFLLLGSSESLGDLQAHFETLHERSRLYQKTISTRILPPTLGSAPMSRGDKTDAPSIDHLMTAYKQTRRVSHGDMIIDQLVGDYIPPCILLNSDQEVLHVYGDAGPFTCKPKPGKFSANIKDLIVPNLSIALATALHRAQTSQTEVTYENVQIELDTSEMASITLRVRFITSNPLNSAHYLLIFENQQQVEKTSTNETIQYNNNDQSYQRITDLENELKKSQEHLQINVEELETTNEELQSSNEELLAANEELQSTNEELQSVNEELFTVNSEYQEKIDELMDANADLDNFIVSTDIGIIFLDDRMTIRNFTPAATKNINMMQTDIGRPFHHIAHNLNYPEFLSDIAQVIDKKNTLEREVFLDQNNVIMIRIRPYVDKRKLTQGVVIAMTDITHIRELEFKLKAICDRLTIHVANHFNQQNDKLNILLLDDSEEDRLLIKHALKKAKLSEYTVIDVGDLQAAQATLESTHIDLCLIDFKLADTDAFEAIQRLKRLQSTEPAFLLMSGLDSDSMLDRALEAGFYDFIEKEKISPYVIDRSIHYAVQHQRVKGFLKETKI